MDPGPQFIILDPMIASYFLVYFSTGYYFLFKTLHVVPLLAGSCSYSYSYFYSSGNAKYQI